MASLHNAHMADPHPTGVSHGGSLAEELFRQLPHTYGSLPRRASRCSNVQRFGGVIRVSKPNTVKNSPGSLSLQAWRRTVMTRARPMIETSYLPTPSLGLPCDTTQSLVQSAPRPASWRPLYQHTLHGRHDPKPLVTPLPLPAPDAHVYHDYVQTPPTPTAYSGCASPAFSPASHAYNQPDTLGSVFFPAENSHRDSRGHALPPLEPSISRCSSMSTFTSSVSALPPFSNALQAKPQVSLWNGLFTRDCSDKRRMAPPTPEYDVATAAVMGFPPLPTPGSATAEQQLASDTAISYQTLDQDDDASEGEIFYGMGLYDAPDKSPSPTSTQDEQGRLWISHGSAAMSLLGGPVPPCPKLRGRGLKLEDSWEPPASDDDGDEDAEEEDDEYR